MDDILGEIISGFSLLREGVVFKHFTLFSYAEIDRFYKESVNCQVSLGIRREKESISDAISKDLWSKSKEDDYDNLAFEIESLTKAREKMHDINRLVMGGKINNLQIKLDQTKKDRNKITFPSAEFFAEQDRVEKFLELALYKDEKFSEKVEDPNLFSEELFEKMEEMNKKENLLTACFSMGFFDIYRINEKNAGNIFGGRGVDITIFQKNLLTYCSLLNAKLSSGKIPDKILNDPIKIYEFNLDKNIDGMSDLKEKAKSGSNISAKDFL